MGHHSIQSKVTKGVHAEAETGKAFSFSNFALADGRFSIQERAEHAGSFELGCYAN